MNSLSNNLFNYATSELSQDAFICWLLSFAMKENEGKDDALTQCAREFIRVFYEMKESECVTEIRRQYDKIDILVLIGEINIIIEDKTFTSLHDNQINKYRESLEAKGISGKNIICVYYKIADQSKPESGVFNIFRKDILELFNKYYDETENSIFRDYCDYIRVIEENSNQYLHSPIEEWGNYPGAYNRFFNSLIEEKVVNVTPDDNWDWKYVANPAGGFMCFWWQPLTLDEQKRIGVGKYISEIYLQIENDIIALKMTSQGSESNEISDIREALFEKMSELIDKRGYTYCKKRFGRGIHMSVGYVKYSFENYKCVIKAMEDSIREIAGRYRYDEESKGFVLM